MFIAWANLSSVGLRSIQDKNILWKWNRTDIGLELDRLILEQVCAAQALIYGAHQVMYESVWFKKIGWCWTERITVEFEIVFHQMKSEINCANIAQPSSSCFCEEYHKVRAYISQRATATNTNERQRDPSLSANVVWQFKGNCFKSFPVLCLIFCFELRRWSLSRSASHTQGLEISGRK